MLFGFLPVFSATRSNTALSGSPSARPFATSLKSSVSSPLCQPVRPAALEDGMPAGSAAVKPVSRFISIPLEMNFDSIISQYFNNIPIHRKGQKKQQRKKGGLLPSCSVHQKLPWQLRVTFLPSCIEFSLARRIASRSQQRGS